MLTESLNLLKTQSISKIQFLEYIESDLDGEDVRFMEIVIGAENYPMIDWFVEYIDDKFGHESYSQTLEIYCRMGKKLDENLRLYLIYSEKFEIYINNIIYYGVNKKTDDNPEGWCSADNNDCNKYDLIYNVSDVNDWVDDLCGGIPASVTAQTSDKDQKTL